MVHWLRVSSLQKGILQQLLLVADVGMMKLLNISFFNALLLNISFSCRYIPRSANVLADSLAKQCLSLYGQNI